MAKTQNGPIITHTEILSLAIGKLETERNYWQEQTAGDPETVKAAAAIVAPHYRKIEALKQLYRIETGNEY